MAHRKASACRRRTQGQRRGQARAAGLVQATEERGQQPQQQRRVLVWQRAGRPARLGCRGGCDRTVEAWQPRREAAALALVPQRLRAQQGASQTMQQCHIQRPPACAAHVTAPYARVQQFTASAHAGPLSAAINSRSARRTVHVHVCLVLRSRPFLDCGDSAGMPATTPCTAGHCLMLAVEARGARTAQQPPCHLAGGAPAEWAGAQRCRAAPRWRCGQHRPAGTPAGPRGLHRAATARPPAPAPSAPQSAPPATTEWARTVFRVWNLIGQHARQRRLHQRLKALLQCLHSKPRQGSSLWPRRPPAQAPSALSKRSSNACTKGQDSVEEAGVRRALQHQHVACRSHCTKFLSKEPRHLENPARTHRLLPGSVGAQPGMHGLPFKPGMAPTSAGPCRTLCVA